MVGVKRVKSKQFVTIVVVSLTFLNGYFFYGRIVFIRELKRDD